MLDSWEKFIPMFEDVDRLTVLPMFKANGAMVVLEKDDQVKMKYLTVAMIASRASGKLAYVSWLCFLVREMAA